MPVAITALAHATTPPPFQQQQENKEQSAAQALLGVMPVETTALLMGLCLPDSSPPAGREGAPYVANMADFTQLYTDRWRGLRV